MKGKSNIGLPAYTFLLNNTNLTEDSLGRFTEAVKEHEAFSDYNAVQRGGGAGRGAYQFDAPSLKTAAKKAIRIYNKNKQEIPREYRDIVKGDITDATQLHPILQDELFFSSLTKVKKGKKGLHVTVASELKKADFSDDNQMADVWQKVHNRGKVDRRESFKNSLNRGNMLKQTALAQSLNQLGAQNSVGVPRLQEGGFNLDPLINQLGQLTPFLEQNGIGTGLADGFNQQFPGQENVGNLLPLLSLLMGQTQTGSNSAIDLNQYSVPGFQGFQQGGGIPTDPEGLRNHNGPVRIPSNNITMQGINQPVLGIGDNGQLQFMLPNQNYHFQGANSVVELPLSLGQGGLALQGVPHAFLGGVFRGIGNVAKGIGKGVLKGASALSDVAEFAAPFAGMLPGGQIWGPALGAAGGLGNYFQNGQQNGIGGLFGNMAGGAASGFGGIGKGTGLLSSVLGSGMGRGAIQGLGSQMAAKANMPTATPGFMGNIGEAGNLGGIMGMLGGGQGGLGSILSLLGGGQGANGLGQLGALLPLILQMSGLKEDGGFSKDGGFIMRDGGFVTADKPTPIQAEKINKTIEQIIWPDAAITNVHAKKSHKQYKKDGEEDKVTDFPEQGAYITSAYGGINIKKERAEEKDLIVKITPYEEGKSGKEPKTTNLADIIFKGNEKEITPAEASERIRKKYKTVEATNSFDDLTNKLNKQSRVPFLQEVIEISEEERIKKEQKKLKRALKKGLSALEKLIGVKMTEGVDKKQAGGIPWIGHIPTVAPALPNLPTLAPPLLPTSAPTWEDLQENKNKGQLLEMIKNVFSGGGQQAPQAGYLVNTPNPLAVNFGLGLSGAGGIGSAINNFLTAGKLGSLYGDQREDLQGFRDNQMQALALSRLTNLMQGDTPQRELLDQRSFVSPTATQAFGQAALDRNRADLFSVLRNNGDANSLAMLNASSLEAQNKGALDLALDRVSREQQILSSRDQVLDQNKQIGFANATDRFNQQGNRLRNIGGLFTDYAGNEQGRIQDDQRLALAQLLQPAQFRSQGFGDINTLGGMLLQASPYLGTNTVV